MLNARLKCVFVSKLNFFVFFCLLSRLFLLPHFKLNFLAEAIKEMGNTFVLVSLQTHSTLFIKLNKT